MASDWMADRAWVALALAAATADCWSRILAAVDWAAKTAWSYCSPNAASRLPNAVIWLASAWAWAFLLLMASADAEGMADPATRPATASAATSRHACRWKILVHV